MDQTWIWNRFTSGIASGEFEQLLGAAEAAAGAQVTIVLDACPVAPPGARDEDIHSPHLPIDLVRFRVSRGELRLEGADFRAGLLNGIGNPETLPALAARIGGVPQLDWIWVDFWAGFRFVLARDARRDEIWSAVEVWKRACRPWLQ